MPLQLAGSLLKRLSYSYLDDYSISEDLLSPSTHSLTLPHSQSDLTCHSAPRLTSPRRGTQLSLYSSTQASTLI